jgi:hypothetical protein
VSVGSSATLKDTATLVGGFNPTGTVTFNLYNNPNGTGTPLFTDANVPLTSGTATSAGYTATETGTDYWVATHNGDTNNNAVSSGTAGEPVTVNAAAPTLSTIPNSGTVTLGSGVPLNDEATLAGGFNPTGTIIFQLFNGSTLLDTRWRRSTATAPTPRRPASRCPAAARLAPTNGSTPTAATLTTTAFLLPPSR